MARSANRRNRRFLLSLTLFGLVLVVPLAAQAKVSLIQISSDPFTDPTSQHATEVEPDTFAFGSTIVSAFQSGRFPNGGASAIGWATSTDGGAAWRHGFLPLTKVAGGTFDAATDPSVAYDAKRGVWLISALPVEGTPASPVIVSRSTDGGLTWSGAVTVAAAPPGSSFDKNWTVCDDTPTSPFYGNCYTEWDDGANGQKVEMSTSSDGGLSWGPVKTPADSGSGAGGQPIVRADGTVVVPIASPDIFAFRSVDGGASWSMMIPVASARLHTLAGGLRGNYPIPSAEVDGTGKVYVAWQDCRFRRNCGSNDIVFSTSTDGLSWSPVRRVPIDPVTSTVDHFIPGLAVDGTTSGAGAHLGLAYYYYPRADCDPSTCRLEVGFVSSTNGGATWSAPTQLAGPMNLSWLANTGSGRMVGDYISTSFTASGLAYPVIAVANAPSGGTFDEAIYTVAGGLPAVGGTVADSNCIVPRVVGKTLKAARGRIAKAHCRTGRITRKVSSLRKKGRVLAQRPRPGTRLKNGAEIKLTVGKGPTSR